MKKVLASIVLALMVIALPVGLVGCKKSVVGTYTFNTIEVSFAEGADEGTKAIVNSQAEEMKNELKDTKLVIKKDNTYTVTTVEGEEKGTWKKDSGDTYIIKADDSEYEQKVTIKGGKVTYTIFSEEQYTVKLIYKK